MENANGDQIETENHLITPPILLEIIAVILFVATILANDYLLKLTFSILSITAAMGAAYIYFYKSPSDEEEEEEEGFTDSLDEWVLRTLAIFKVLSSRVRVEILFILRDGELSVSEIMEELNAIGYDLSEKSVRYHLNMLVFHGLVLWRRAGLRGESYFYLTDLGQFLLDEINNIADYLYELDEGDSDVGEP